MSIEVQYHVFPENGTPATCVLGDRYKFGWLKECTLKTALPPPPRIMARPLFSFPASLAYHKYSSEIIQNLRIPNNCVY